MKLLRNVICVVLEEMTEKINLNLQRIGVSYVPDDWNYSISCHSKINGFRREVGKMAWENNTERKRHQKGCGACDRGKP